jgi:hypothetical protein
MQARTQPGPARLSARASAGARNRLFVRPGLIAVLYVLAPLGAQAAASQEYLIITRDMFVAALSPLVAARQAAGLDVHVVTLTEIEDACKGMDPQEKIRNYIIGRYRDHNAAWVLLVGCPDADDNPGLAATLKPTVVDKPWELPVRYVYAPVTQFSPDNYVYIPAEAYYSCLDGTWDADHDGVFGERAVDCALGIDEVDWLPEVNLGRIPARTAQQVTDYVDKLLSTDYTGLSAEDLHVLQLNCAVNDELCDYSVPGLVLADAPGYTAPTSTRIDAELNSGQYPLLTHTGHGSTYAWQFETDAWTAAQLGVQNSVDVEQSRVENSDGVAAWESLAQTFKPRAPVLFGAKVYVWRRLDPPGGPLVVSVRTSLDGPDLARGTIEAGTMTSLFGWCTVAFGPINVVPGQEYILAVTSPDSTTPGHMWDVGRSVDEAYPDGVAYVYARWDPGWKSQTYDLTFATIDQDPNDPAAQDCGRPFFAYASACLTAYLDQSNEETTIAEQLLFRPRLGALGYVGAWRLSTPIGQNDLWRDFWRAFFDNSITQPSRALNAAQRSYYFCYAYWHHGWYNYYRYTQLIYSYLGDPYLQIGSVPANGPVVVSVPAVTAENHAPYWYDDDCRAEAVGEGPIVWEKVSGPQDFHIASAGLVDWSPAPGSEPGNDGRPMIVLRAGDENGFTYHRWVVQCGIFVRITSAANSQGQVGRAYHYDTDDTAEATIPTNWSAPNMTPLRWKKVAGPVEMIVDPETGKVTWTPDKAGEHEVILGASYSYGCDFQRFVISVTH